MRREFWSGRRGWQSDQEGHVFLAEALLRVGRALFPAEWTDADPSAGPPPAPSPALKMSLPSLNRLRAAPTPLTESEFAALQDQYAAGLAAALPAMRRTAAAQEALVRGFKSSGIRTAGRALRGGKLTALPEDAWFTERWHPRFILCCMNLADRYGIAFSGDAPTWRHIFVNAEDLERYVASISAQPKGRPRGSSKYDWPAFEKECLKKLEHEGGVHLASDPGFKQADLERHMADWCGTAWSETPAISTMRERVKKSVQDYEARK